MFEFQRSEVFCDTTKIPIVKKRVKQISEQDPFESRRLSPLLILHATYFLLSALTSFLPCPPRLWKDVTLNLKKKDVQEATKYKQALEQRQREEAKLRAETGAPIKHKVRNLTVGCSIAVGIQGCDHEAIIIVATRCQPFP